MACRAQCAFALLLVCVVLCAVPGHAADEDDVFKKKVDDVEDIPGVVPEEPEENGVAHAKPLAAREDPVGKKPVVLQPVAQEVATREFPRPPMLAALPFPKLSPAEKQSKLEELINGLDRVVVELRSSGAQLKAIKAREDKEKAEHDKDPWYIRAARRAKRAVKGNGKDTIPDEIAKPLFIFMKQMHYLNDLNKAAEENMDEMFGEESVAVNGNVFNNVLGAIHDAVEALIMILPEKTGESIKMNIRKRLHHTERQLDKLSTRLAEAKRDVFRGEQESYCDEDNMEARSEDEEEVHGDDDESSELEDDADGRIDLSESLAEKRIRTSEELSLQDELANAKRNRRKSNAREFAEVVGTGILTSGLGAAYFMRDDIVEAIPAWPIQREYVDMPTFGPDIGAGERLVGNVETGIAMKDEAMVHGEKANEIYQTVDAKRERLMEIEQEISADMTRSQELVNENQQLYHENQALVNERVQIDRNAATRFPPGRTPEEQQRINEIDSDLNDNRDTMQNNMHEMDEIRIRQEANMQEMQQHIEDIEAYEEDINAMVDFGGRVKDLGQEAWGNLSDLIASIKTTFVDWPQALWSNIVTFAISALPDILVTCAEFIVSSLTGPFFLLGQARLLYKIIKWAMKPPALKRSEMCNPKVIEKCCMDELERLGTIANIEENTLVLTKKWTRKQGHVSSSKCKATSAFMRANIDTLAKEKKFYKTLSAQTYKKENFCQKHVVPFLQCGKEECRMCAQVASLASTKASLSDMCDGFTVNMNEYLTTTKTYETERMSAVARQDLVRHQKCNVMVSHFKKYHSDKRIRSQDTFPMPICIESGFCMKEEMFPKYSSSACMDCTQMVLRATIGADIGKVCSSLSKGYKERVTVCKAVKKELYEIPLGERLTVATSSMIFGDKEKVYEPDTPLVSVLSHVPQKAAGMCQAWCGDSAPRLVVPNDADWIELGLANTASSESHWVAEEDSPSIFGYLGRKVRKIRGKMSVDDARLELNSHLSSSLASWTKNLRKIEESMKETDEKRIRNKQMPVGGVTGQVIAANQQLHEQMVQGLQHAYESLSQFQKVKALETNAVLEALYGDVDEEKEMVPDTKAVAVAPTEKKKEAEMRTAMLKKFFDDFEQSFQAMLGIYEKFKEEELGKFKLPEEKKLPFFSTNAWAEKRDVEDRLDYWTNLLKCKSVLLISYRKFRIKCEEMADAFKSGLTFLERARETGQVHDKVNYKVILKVLKKIKPEKLLEKAAKKFDKYQKKMFGEVTLIGRNTLEKCFLDGHGTLEEISEWPALVAITKDIKTVKKIYGKTGEMSRVHTLWMQAAGLANELTGDIIQLEEELDREMTGLRELVAYGMETYRMGKNTSSFFSSMKSDLSSATDKAISVWKTSLKRLGDLRSAAGVQDSAEEKQK